MAPGTEHPKRTSPPAPSALLSRLQDFLPAMRAANNALDASSADIEDLTDPEHYVQMDLSCGVFELAPAAAAAEKAVEDGGELRLPSASPTKAVAAARRAGRTLIAEVAESEGEHRSNKRPRRRRPRGDPK